jgi:membrane protein DedA with SNARE-associated domain
MSVFEHITIWVTNTIETLGYPGLAFLMALESMIAPIPSEAVMPFAGFLAFEGKMSMILIGVWSTTGSIVGSLISYYMGLYGGRPLVLSIGKYLFLNVHHLDSTERFFKRYGGITVFICRFIPVVRHFISIPAGIGKMPMGWFLLYTTIGALTWNMILAVVGFKLRERWDMLTPYFHIVDRVIVIAALVVIVVYISGQIMQRRKSQSAGQS